ncbi:hypothetical protein [Streptomyces megasporus]|uniref:hypothetical protein n=1 Tax=Streptomyces megasporus TaxID=44060 RepID=UPI0004E0FD31|nr:hypothetical protein [Streptomyces megasporus]
MSLVPSIGFRTAVPLVFGLSLLASGCGTEEEKREYAVPESLCDLDIGAGLIEPFLPTGKRISQVPDDDGTDWSCDVSVDDKDVFQMTWEWWEPGWSARRFAPSQAYVKPEYEAADKSYVYSDRGAVTAVRCTEQGKKWDVFLVARVRNTGVSNAEAMEKFITAYREEFLRSDPCADL